MFPNDIIAFDWCSCNRSYSRLLLGVDTSPSCPGGGDQFVNAASDSSTITIENVTVCASGENIIVYDIGTVDEQGSFSILVPNAYSAQFVVQTGPAACFRLVMQSARLERFAWPAENKQRVQFEQKIWQSKHLAQG